MIIKSKARLLLWPIRLGWARRTAHQFFTWHGWQCGSERCSLDETSDGCMPGIRRVCGWTLHIGAFKVYFGARGGLKTVTISHAEWMGALAVLGELNPVQWDEPPEDLWKRSLEKLRNSIVIDRGEWFRLRARSSTLEEYEAFARAVEERSHPERRSN